MLAPIQSTLFINDLEKGLDRKKVIWGVKPEADWELLQRMSYTEKNQQ